jgi:primosomal protein N' (replication factor Y)
MASVLRRFISEPRQAILGPAEAPIARMNNRYRWHFLLKAATSRSLHQWLQTTLAYADKQRQSHPGTRISVDMDPMSFV